MVPRERPRDMTLGMTLLTAFLTAYMFVYVFTTLLIKGPMSLILDLTRVKHAVLLEILKSLSCLDL